MKKIIVLTLQINQTISIGINCTIFFFNVSVNNKKRPDLIMLFFQDKCAFQGATSGSWGLHGVPLLRLVTMATP